MLKINKNNIPKELVDYKKNNTKTTYKDIPNILKSSLKKSLLREQNYYCCYCCRNIDDYNSNIEHIVPQKIVKDTLDYNNLLVSCNSSGRNKSEMTCNAYKSDKYNKDLFVSPLDDDCESLFQFNVGTGDIESVNELNIKKRKKVEYTIKVLNLNARRLSSERKSIIKMLTSMCMGGLDAKDAYATMNENKYDFLDVTKWYLKSFYNLTL